MFFDYNGNGKQDNDEPPVQNAQVIIADAIDTTKIITQGVTDSSGDYKVDIPAGNYQLFIKPDATDPKSPVFRYMCQSDADVTDIGKGCPLNVLNSGNFDVGLMEGFLTLPFPKGVPIYVNPDWGDYFFHGPAEPDALWWNGHRLPGPRPHKPPYAHPETDFAMPEGTEVKAALPGIVNFIYENPGDPSFITLKHDNDWYTTYVHPSKFIVPPRAKVNRGDTIALSSNIGTGCNQCDYHTAFQLRKHMPDGSDYYIDPYSPVSGVPKGAWVPPPANRANGVFIGGDWTWHPSNDEWISQGYWTKLNDPQYPDSE